MVFAVSIIYGEKNRGLRPPVTPPYGSFLRPTVPLIREGSYTEYVMAAANGTNALLYCLNIASYTAKLLSFT